MVGLKRPELYISWPSQSLKNELHLLVESKIPNKADKGIYTSAFGENDSLQTRQDVANIISLKGEVVSIFDNINAVHLKIDSKEASRLSRDERVLLVEQDRLLTTASTRQTDSDWGLGRIDELSPYSDNDYDYSFTGSGRTIYVLDSGLNLGITKVDNEFGGGRTSAMSSLETCEEEGDRRRVRVSVAV